MIARYDKHKDHENLFRALDIVKSKGYKFYLLLAGYNINDKNILPEIKSININNKIIYRAKYGICMYSPSPCAGYIKNFNINQKWGYLILDIN